jgi:peptidyl-prolyl cis-trans isomerase A (cyclophilin A)
MSATGLPAWDAGQTVEQEFVRGEVFAKAGAGESHVTVAGNGRPASAEPSPRPACFPRRSRVESGTMHRRKFLAVPAALALAARHSTAAEAAIVRTRVETALGSFVIAVDPAVAPITTANYLAYVDRRYLDGGSVYRIVTLANQGPQTRHKIEVVQWGMNVPDDKPAPLPPIAHETTRLSGLRHLDGTVSMARNAPGTAAAEFFICVGDQPELDFGGGRNPDGQGFAAFGRVVEGMPVVRALHAQGQAEQILPSPIPVRAVRRI